MTRGDSAEPRGGGGGGRGGGGRGQGRQEQDQQQVPSQLVPHLTFVISPEGPGSTGGPMEGPGSTGGPMEGPGSTGAPPGGRPLEVYLDLLSQPCRAVLIMLTCNRIPHKVRTVALRKGENTTAEFTQLNPMKKVPVMVDKGFTLTESDAILKYLATKYDVPEHWYPRQPERRARVDEYTAWHHTNTRPHAAKVFLLEVLLPAQSGGQVDQERLGGALAQLEETLSRLEAMFLRRQPFLCGDDVTVADLLALCELMQPAASGRDVLVGRPQLQRWRSRVQAAVGDSFHQAHAVLFALRDRRRARL